MYDKAASMSRLQYLLYVHSFLLHIHTHSHALTRTTWRSRRIAGAIGVPFMLWRGYVKNVLLPQPFRQVSKKLTTNEVVSKLLGDEVIPHHPSHHSPTYIAPVLDHATGTDHITDLPSGESVQEIQRNDRQEHGHL